MTKCQEVVLNLVKYYFWNEADLDTIIDVNWNEVISESIYHRLVPFVFSGISKVISEHKELQLKIDEELLKQVKDITLMTIVHNCESVKKQKEILNVLSKENIKYCILKGTSLSVFYPDPKLRALGDLDIYVRPEDFNTASEVIKSMGYQYQKTTTQYHVAYAYNGYEIELHNSIAGLPTGKTREKLMFMKNLCERGKKGDELLANYFVPCVCDNGIVQLLHMIHHILDEGMRFRLLCDWMMFVDKNISDEVWNNQLYKVYNDVNLVHMAKVLTKMCKLYLGLNNSNITWCDNIRADECDAFLEYILEKDEVRKKQKNKKISDKPYEAVLREDIWEYKGKNKINYMINLAYRNIMYLISGKRSIGQCITFWNEKKQNENKLVNLNLFNRKAAKDYVF